MFRKAERKQVKLKIGFSAPSGAGKTYSALLVAYGMCGDWDKVAVIDTENGSAELYSDLGGYSVCPITPPFTPRKYTYAIQEAVDAGFKVLIIDSLSHAWSGEGGLLEMKDKAANANKSGNTFTAWRDVTPEHNRLVNAILQSDIDVIVTTRAKSDYVVTQDNGKTNVKKVGLAPVFREGLEFELTSFFDLSQEHVATASKDRTKMFDGIDFIPTIETGKMLSAWRDSGAAIVLVTQEQKDALIALGSKIEDVAKYFQVSADRLTYEQAQRAIEMKSKQQKNKPSSAPPATPPEQISETQAEPPQEENATVSEHSVRVLQIEKVVFGTKYNLDYANEYARDKYGKSHIDELTDAQYSELYAALCDLIQKEREGADGNN